MGAGRSRRLMILLILSATEADFDAGCYSRHCRMSEASQSKPTPNIKTGPIINLPGMGWECGQANSIYTRAAPAKVSVVAQIREIMRLMTAPLLALPKGTTKMAPAEATPLCPSLFTGRCRALDFVLVDSKRFLRIFNCVLRCPAGYPRGWDRHPPSRCCWSIDQQHWLRRSFDQRGVHTLP
jgi:hypothetical protein